MVFGARKVLALAIARRISQYSGSRIAFFVQAKAMAGDRFALEPKRALAVFDLIWSMVSIAGGFTSEPWSAAGKMLVRSIASLVES